MYLMYQLDPTQSLSIMIPQAQSRMPTSQGWSVGSWPHSYLLR